MQNDNDAKCQWYINVNVAKCQCLQNANIKNRKWSTLQIWDTTKKCTQYSGIAVINFTVFNCIYYIWLQK